MLDLDAIRAEFARHLAANSGQRWRLDASVAHVCEVAYRQGLADGASAADAAATLRRVADGIGAPARHDA